MDDLELGLAIFSVEMLTWACAEAVLEGECGGSGRGTARGSRLVRGGPFSLIRENNIQRGKLSCQSFFNHS